MSRLCLFFEVSRIIANVSKCIMYNPFPELTKETVNEIFTFFDPNDPYSKVEKLEFELSKKLEKTEVFGVDLVYIPFFYLVNRIVCLGKVIITPELQFYICKQEDKEWAKNQLKKIRKIEENILKSGNTSKIYKINKIEGNLLGYPKCCVENFVRRKKLRNSGKRITSPEGLIAMEFIENGYHTILDSIFLKKENIMNVKLPLTLFAFNFYPCKLNCKRAEKIGNTCFEKMSEIGMEKLFRAGIVAVMCNVLSMCIKMKIVDGTNRTYSYYSPEKIIKHLI